MVVEATESFDPSPGIPVPAVSSGGKASSDSFDAPRESDFGASNKGPDETLVTSESALLSIPPDEPVELKRKLSDGALMGILVLNKNGDRGSETNGKERNAKIH
jgi:hypothetical protein